MSEYVPSRSYHRISVEHRNFVFKIFPSGRTYCRWLISRKMTFPVTFHPLYISLLTRQAVPMKVLETSSSPKTLSSSTSS